MFVSQILSVYVTSLSAPSWWYAAGDFYQAFIVPFGDSGAAQGELTKLVLNRYTIINFQKFPMDSPYLVSYSPKYYFKDVTLQVWEKVSTHNSLNS